MLVLLLPMVAGAVAAEGMVAVVTGGEVQISRCWNHWEGGCSTKAFSHWSVFLNCLCSCASVSRCMLQVGCLIVLVILAIQRGPSMPSQRARIVKSIKRTIHKPTIKFLEATARKQRAWNPRKPKATHWKANKVRKKAAKRKLGRPKARTAKGWDCDAHNSKNNADKTITVCKGKALKI